MPESKNRFHRFKHSHLQIIGAVFLLLLALLLLWRGNATSNQAVPAMVAQVYFDGEYRISGGQWQQIVKGEHIPATKGDVTLRGNFHMLTPDGEYIGIYSGDMPIALYTDHINLTVYAYGNEPYVMDIENPLYGDSTCGVYWSAYSLTNGSEEPVEILIHNPHSFGNENAIDELLSNMAFWSGLDFEKGVLESGEFQRNLGLFFMIVALVLIGIALFSTLIHIKSSRLLWIFGMVILFAGTYFAYSASGVSFWNNSVVSNTTILGSAMILYMLFLSMGIVSFLRSSKKTGMIAVLCLGAADALFFVIPVVTDILFYDTWFCWVAAQLIVNLILLICLVKECFCKNGRRNWLYIGAILLLIACGVDLAMTDLGIWKGGVVSTRYGGTVTANNSEVYGNSASYGGFVGVSSSGSYGVKVECKDTVIRNNYASTAGAAFYLQDNYGSITKTHGDNSHGVLKLDGCTLEKNGSPDGLIYSYVYYTPAWIEDTTIADNECAVYTYGSNENRSFCKL